MGCIKGKDKLKKGKGGFRCKKCGGTSEKKKDICKPEKIKKPKKEGNKK
jgi:tRNA(Ile2) C34 agmatinyltransferase TiaS